MGSYRTHTIGGMLSFAGCIAALAFLSSTEISIEKGLALFAITLMAALFPDIDTDSKGQNLFYSIFLLLDVYFILGKNYRYAAILGLLVMIPVVSRHRGWTHTLWAMVLIPAPILFLPWLLLGAELSKLVIYYVCAVAGYFSHLVIDGKYT
ncbi:MAG: metal-dependent hydrolase [Deltaproteobacteria bacterium]|nr:metal-dependent hydrolase [Deltaproteobacteria bacterium]